MAIAITASIAKKVPLPGVDYASRQASISVTGEVSSLDQIGSESARLFAAAQAAVDAQLGLPPQPTRVDHANPSLVPGQTANAAQRTVTTPPSGSARRSPGRATPSQLQLLQRLIGSNQPQTVAICAHYGSPDLAGLTVRQASEAIDQLKGDHQ